VGVKEGYPENYSEYRNNNMKIVRKAINIDLKLTSKNFIKKMMLNIFALI